MSRIASTLLALALAVPFGLALQQTKTDQAASQSAPPLRDLILTGNVDESVRVARQNPGEVAAVLNRILEEVDAQITDRKISEARSSLAAVDKFTDAYASPSDSGNRALRDAIKGRILRVDGIQLSDDAHFDKAEPKLWEALELSTKAGDKRLEGGIHNNLGYALMGLERLDDAAREFDSARTIAEEQKDPLRAGSYNFNFGLALFRLGSNEEALRAFSRSEEQNKSVSKTSMEARAVLYQGIVTSKMHPTGKEPMSYLTRAEKMFEQLGDSRNTGLSLWLMAQQTAFGGDLTEAGHVAEKAVPFLVKANDKDTLALCYGFIAMAYDQSKSEEDRAKAEKYKKLAEEIKKENPG